MTQSKLESLIESFVNVFIGTVVGFASQVLIFHAYDIKIPWSTNVSICAWFTFVSVARSYIIRRWFNERLRKAIRNNIGSS